MADNKEYMTKQEEMGSIHISEDVVATIAATAALDVEGVTGLITDLRNNKKVSTKGVRIDSVGENEFSINISITVRYGCAVCEIAEKVQQNVFSSLECMTGFTVKAVNVHVAGISFAE